MLSFVSLFLLLFFFAEKTMFTFQTLKLNIYHKFGNEGMRVANL